MKRKRLLPKCLFAAAVPTLSAIAAMLAGCTTVDSNNKLNKDQNKAVSNNRLITVLNPAVTEKLAERVSLAPRLNTLEGKTLYLVDVNYEGIKGTPVMGEIKAWFTKNLPNVKTVLKLKKGSYIADDPALWKEIKDKGGDGVILGVAG